jgi:hypothetical protein
VPPEPWEHWALLPRSGPVIYAGHSGPIWIVCAPHFAQGRSDGHANAKTALVYACTQIFLPEDGREVQLGFSAEAKRVFFLYSRNGSFRFFEPKLVRNPGGNAIDPQQRTRNLKINTARDDRVIFAAGSEVEGQDNGEAIAVLTLDPGTKNKRVLVFGPEPESKIVADFSVPETTTQIALIPSRGPNSTREWLADRIRPFGALSRLVVALASDSRVLSSHLAEPQLQDATP